MTRTQRNIYNDLYVNHGWVVAGQYKDMLAGEPIEAQNSNALRYIAYTLEDFKEGDASVAEMQEEIREYLEAEKAA